MAQTKPTPQLPPHIIERLKRYAAKTTVETAIAESIEDVVMLKLRGFEQHFCLDGVWIRRA